MSADLHIHSTASDGSFSPEEIVEKAEKAGINTIALADHDTVDGIKRALEYAKDKKVEVIPALEFSTFREKAEIHLLGYFIDYTNDILLDQINKIFQARMERAEKMVDLLNKEGVEITLAQVKEAAGDEYIGRPHIARVMVNQGYIQEIGEAFSEKYIGNEGKAYVSKYKLTPEEAVAIIKQAGGIPVLAHPAFINHGQPLEKNEIRALQKKGLEGIEVYHSKHSEKDKDYYLKTARELNLLITGGSDFHGENAPDIELGQVVIADKYVEKLKQAERVNK